jgi:TatD DNase family protein
MYFDTHTHVNFAAYKDDREETIKRALEAKTWMTNVGTQTDTSQSAADLAQKYPEGVYAAIGLHPVHTYQQMLDEEESHFQSRDESFDEAVYESMLSEKVVAIGECGLDYFRLPAEGQEAAIRKQKTEFIKQLEFAKKHGLPVIIHCRDAYKDLLDILKSEYAGFPGVAHSFTDTWDTAKNFLDLGFYIALNGILTFDKTGKLAEVVEKSPLDHLLTETDAPYLTPPPYRGKRNEPAYVRYVAAKIAQIKKIDPEEAGDQTFQNASELFRIRL